MPRLEAFSHREEIPLLRGKSGPEGKEKEEKKLVKLVIVYPLLWGRIKIRRNFTGTWAIFVKSSSSNAPTTLMMKPVLRRCNHNLMPVRMFAKKERSVASRSDPSFHSVLIQVRHPPALRDTRLVQNPCEFRGPVRYGKPDRGQSGIFEQAIAASELKTEGSSRGAVIGCDGEKWLPTIRQWLKI
ncbi:unnamed protein product [Nesidiocoris tenuis]|uniref:Uncharacterized protein n=1 Tax=Nesidiocoris tenuis TaxID=355587 RepID=A0A6H5G2A2_9HEMI|nr:unnamed protein product [Nesidiocoris tenuis]